MQIRKILCATDGSHVSEKAVAFASAFARQLGAELTFATVNMVADSVEPTERVWDVEMLRLGEAQVQRHLHSAVLAAHQAGLPHVQGVEIHGRNIAGAVIKYAEDNGFDHIIAGSTGKTGVTRLLLGSVAGEIVAKAHCPVTVVR